MKIAGSGSACGSISQRHGSADPDQLPHQNVIDPELCLPPCQKYCTSAPSTLGWAPSPLLISPSRSYVSSKVTWGGPSCQCSGSGSESGSGSTGSTCCWASQRYGSGSGSGSGSFNHQAKIVKKALIPPVL